MTKHDVTHLIWKILARFRNLELRMNGLRYRYPETNFTTTASFHGIFDDAVVSFLENTLKKMGWQKSQYGWGKTIKNKNFLISIQTDKITKHAPRFDVTVFQYRAKPVDR